MAILKVHDGSGFIEVGANPNGVIGPASSTDNAICRFDGTTGRIIQDSGVTIDDSNHVALPTDSQLKLDDDGDTNLYCSFDDIFNIVVGNAIKLTLTNTNATLNLPLTLQGNNITDVGDLELDSLTKDGAGDIAVNDNVDLQGNNLVNAGDVECDSLTKDGVGSITINSSVTLNEDMDFNGNNANNVANMLHEADITLFSTATAYSF